MKNHRSLLLVAAALLFATASHAAPVLSWSTDVTRGVGPLSVRVTWSSTGAVTCIASGAWSGVKPLSGTQTIVFNNSGDITLRCEDAAGNGTAVIGWTAPTHNTDGTALTDLASYKIYYGPATSTLDRTVSEIPVGILTYSIDALPPGTWYFAMTAKNSTGIESLRTNLASKLIVGAPVQFDTKTIRITVDKQPNPPGGLVVTELTAYDVRFNFDKWQLVLNRKVGTVELGVACNEDKPVGDGYYELAQRNTRKLHLTRSPQSPVVARCG